jgi:hypothetical protein
MKTLKARSLEKMHGYSGNVIELTGRNDHPIIDKAQRLLGLPQDAPYCVAIVIWADCVALAERLGIDATNETLMKWEVLPRLREIAPVSGSCTEMMRQAQKRGDWIPADEWERAEEGDRVIFDFTPPKTRRNPNPAIQRHFGVLDDDPLPPDPDDPAEMRRKRLRTVEGNTSPDKETPVETNDARKNGGVWPKKRKLGSTPGYKVLGYLRGPK